MAQFAPIDYGSAPAVNTSGIQTAEAATQEHAARLVGAAQQAGQNLQQAGDIVAQTTLHRQALEATTDAARGTADAQALLEKNPFYITHDTISGSLKDQTKADALWNSAKAKGLVISDPKTGDDYIPTFAVGRDLYAAMTKETRDEAAKKISLPGWQAEFSKTAEQESLLKQERYINPMMGRYETDYNKAKSLQSWREQADTARAPEDFNHILAGIQGSPSITPEEKVALQTHYSKQRDTVIADRAMTDPVAQEDVMKQELVKLQGPNARQDYSALDDKEREELATQLQGKLKFVESMREHDEEMKHRHDLQADDKAAGRFIKDMLINKYSPTDFYPDPKKPGSGIGSQTIENMKTREGQENLYHFVQSMIRNEQASAKVKTDTPGVYAAISTLYSKDIEGFRQAMDSKKPVVIPGWENLGPVDLATSLTKESYDHFWEKYAGLGDKDRAKEDASAEGRFQMRLGAAITSEDGGRQSADDWSDPVWRTQHMDMENFVTGALKEAQDAAVRKSGHKLAWPEEQKVMLQAAKTYTDTGGNPDYHWSGGKPGEGTAIETKAGTRPLGMKERTYMMEGRHAAGYVGNIDLQAEGADFYDNYKPVIEDAWKKVFKSDPDLEDTWRTYYEAKSTPGNGTAKQVLDAIQKIFTQHEAIKKGGQ